MTEKETSVILEAISAYYQKFQTNKLSLKAWHGALKSYDYEDVKSALVNHTHESPYVPTVADLIHQIKQAKEALNGTLSALEAWGEVITLVKKHGYYNEANAFNDMDELTSKAVKIIGYKNLCTMPTDEQAIYRAQFERAYQTVKERKVRDEKFVDVMSLTGQVRNLIEGVK
jgi:hypothetical protein